MAWRTGPLEVTVDRDDRWFLLTAAAGTMVVAGAVLAVSGVPETPLMWPMYSLGLVLPTCGLTRGVAALMGLRVADAWQYNPASFLLVAMAALSLVRAALGVTTRHWIHLRLRPGPVVIAAVIVVVALLWIRQQGHAELLMG